MQELLILFKLKSAPINRYTQPKREMGADERTKYISRWRQIISDYNAVRARLFHSQRLLEGTNLALFNVNETTLVSVQYFIYCLQ